MTWVQHKWELRKPCATQMDHENVQPAHTIEAGNSNCTRIGLSERQQTHTDTNDNSKRAKNTGNQRPKAAFNEEEPAGTRSKSNTHFAISPFE